MREVEGGRFGLVFWLLLWLMLCCYIRVILIPVMDLVGTQLVYYGIAIVKVLIEIRYQLCLFKFSHGSYESNSVRGRVENVACGTVARTEGFQFIQDYKCNSLNIGAS